MIGRALRAEIDAYAVQMRRSNPLFTKAVNGTLTPAMIARYLANIFHGLSVAQQYLARARDRARELGDEGLTAHYAKKTGEEAGHEAWAARDLERVTKQTKIRVHVPREVVPAMRELNAWLADAIEEDPALYLAHILFSEQLIVLLGPEWLDLLETRCGIPRSSMTAIANHVELDKHHVEEALAEIDDLVGDPQKIGAMRETLRTSMAFFDRFCTEVTSIEARDASKQSFKHTSAA